MYKKILLPFLILTLIFIVGLSAFTIPIPISSQTENFTLTLSGDDYEPTTSLTKRTINGTEFTLLSNTNQCLSNCEAWIEWDLTKGILTDTQIPTIATNQFDFKIVKENEKTEDLKDFGIEVWEEIGIEIQDYKEEQETYFENLEDLIGTDLNVQTEKFTCENFDCVEKEKNVCSCTRTIIVPDGTHINYEWKKIANDFYGFNAIKGKIYRLRVWGNKKAKLGSNNIDWIPTFFGKEITKWAWWNSEWGFKQKITLNTDGISLSSDVTTDHIILIEINSENTDFWDNVDAEGDDVRFVGTTEYDYYFQKFDSGTDEMLAWVEVTDTFTSATDLEFYMYYGNSEASSAENASNTLNSYEAVYHFDEGTGTAMADATGNNPATAESSSAWSSTSKIGDNSFYPNELYNAIAATLLDNSVTLGRFGTSFWVNLDTVIDSDTTVTNMITSKANNNDDQYYNMFPKDTGFFQLYGNVNNAVKHLFSEKNSWASGTWFHLITTWDETTGQSMYLDGVRIAYDPTHTELMPEGTFQNYFMGCHYNHASCFDGKIDELKVFNIGITEDDVRILYNSELGNLVTFSSQETSSSCSCPVSDNWEIINGDVCTLSTECNLSSGSLYIISGSLNITSTGILSIPSGEKIVIEKDNNISIQNGGKIIIHK